MTGPIRFERGSYGRARARRLLAEVRAAPMFVAFAAVVGIRARRGRALSAVRMLVAIGAPPGIAYDIVDGWPTPSTRLIPALPLDLEQACRLACYIGNVSNYRWNEQLESALLGAKGPIPE